MDPPASCYVVRNMGSVSRQKSADLALDFLTNISDPVPDLPLYLIGRPTSSRLYGESHATSSGSSLPILRFTLVLPSFLVPTMHEPAVPPEARLTGNEISVIDRSRFLRNDSIHHLLLKLPIGSGRQTKHAPCFHHPLRRSTH